MFFGPLHFLLIRAIVQALQARVPEKSTILDLGCGTGVAGAAWALESNPPPRLIGIDRNPWALEESRWTYQSLGVRGVTRNVDLRSLTIPPNTAVVAAFTINELDPDTRKHFLTELLKVHRRGFPALVIEPIARRLTSWWDDWSKDWTEAGGREDQWRFRIDLPERLALMDRAAGLDHRELTGRSLWLPGSA
jgi:ubiquinone/menaquinone biosynthesis C-methylase UbiE